MNTFSSASKVQENVFTLEVENTTALWIAESELYSLQSIGKQDETGLQNGNAGQREYCRPDHSPHKKVHTVKESKLAVFAAHHYSFA